MTQEEYSKMLAAAKDQFNSGQPLFGKDGAFDQVLEDFLNAALEGEMQSHLESTKPESGNRRNGKMRKQLQTEYGPVEIGTPRDRDGSFACSLSSMEMNITPLSESSFLAMRSRLAINESHLEWR